MFSKATGDVEKGQHVKNQLVSQAVFPFVENLSDLDLPLPYFSRTTESLGSLAGLQNSDSKGCECCKQTA